jgi:hypothetical protein
MFLLVPAAVLLLLALFTASNRLARALGTTYWATELFVCIFLTATLIGIPVVVKFTGKRSGEG